MILDVLRSPFRRQARSKMTAIEENARLLLEEYGGFRHTTATNAPSR
ncbi:MAG: hypothetical protein WB762_29295 [Candidatus Sulfotelmatobacter sp.]